MEWNRVHYIDCMDLDEGLPSLPDKSIDLCITDPPYNIKFKGTKNKVNPESHQFYEDNIKDYKEWSYKWFYEINRICNRIIFSPGLKNLKQWYEIEDFGLVIWHNPEKQGGSKAASFAKFEPFLTLNLKPPNKFSLGIFKYFNEGPHGFFNRNGMKCIHPCPRSSKVINHIIKELSPISVIDPFLGSGTTAEVCTKLGIPWIGYEIMEEYSVDINKRLKGCKREPKQITLEAEIYR